MVSDSVGTKHRWSSELSAWGSYLNADQPFAWVSPCQAACSALVPEMFSNKESNGKLCRRGLHPQVRGMPRVAGSAALLAKPLLVRQSGTLG